MTTSNLVLSLALAAATVLLCACERAGDGGLPLVGQLNTGTGDSGEMGDLTVKLLAGTSLAASPAPDGKRVVFSMHGALWIMPLAGGKAQRITGWELEATHPVWSPDGATIAFQNYTQDGNFHIWTIRPDGRAATELTSGPFDDREPAWLPDASGLLFASDRGGDGQYKIWRLTQHGTSNPRLTRLTHGKGAEGQPAISPDGRQLAWTDSGRIFTLALGGCAAPAPVAIGSAPGWTPDGRALVYHNARGQLTLAEREITSGEELSPFPVRFLPDGRFLYTADGKIRLRRADGRLAADLRVGASMPVRPAPSGRLRERGFSLPGVRPLMGVSAPALSPDGASVAFIALNDVWVMVLGQAPRRLTHDLDRDTGVQWTPSGGAVYFASDRGNGGHLAIDQVQLDSGVRARLAALPGRSLANPKMSRSGETIAFTGEQGQLGVWHVAGQRAEPVAAGAGEVSAPSWSADGKHLLVVGKERSNSRFPEGYNKLRVSAVAGGATRFFEVAPAPRQISDRGEGAAVLSPDGRQLAFIMDAVLHVMPVNPDGSPAGPARQLTREAADMPSWSGDSGTILFKAADGLKLVSAAGGPERAFPVRLAWRNAVPAGTLLIRAGALWDGMSPVLQRDVDIFVTGNRISAISPAREGSTGQAARVIDARELTVMPGMWDSALRHHVRFGASAAAMLARGITSAVSAGGPLHEGIGLREAIDAGNMIGPRLFASGAQLGGNRVSGSHERSLRTAQVADLEFAKGARMGVDLLLPGPRAPLSVRNRIARTGLAFGMRPAPAAGGHRALQTLTIDAARAMRVERDLGSVEEGKLADLVAVRGNPLLDFSATDNVTYVIRNGKAFTPADILGYPRPPVSYPRD